jgi:outer membrane receptor protein involved in Fe transport
VAIVGSLNVVAAASDALTRTVRFEIPAQSLESALLEFSKQAQVPVFVNAHAVEDLRAPAVVGALPANMALERLLQESGLAYSAVGEAITVGPSATAHASDPVRFVRTAQQETGDGRSASSASSNSGEITLQEVVVTAQKREERLQDVPVPVTAIDASTLANNNQDRVQDYFSTVPGLSAAPVAGLGTSQVAIRGVTTGGITNPTVGIVIDDVPYGSSSYWANGFAAPDIDPNDLSRLEVLRGPQGTLYGASSMGGLIKFVTVDPSTVGTAGSLQVGSTSVRNGRDLGYNARGAVNVPLSDIVAIRASAFTRQDPGYIDNVQTGERGVNETHAHGGRLAMLWRPSAEFTVKLSALLQNGKVDGDSFVDVLPGMGDLQHSALRGTGWNKTKTEAYSAIVSGKVGGVELSSMSGYNVATQHTSYDFSDSGFWSGSIHDLYGVTGAPLLTGVKTSRFTQEFRVSSPLGDHFDGLIGAFYSDEHSSLVQTIPGADQNTGQIVGDFFAFTVPTTLKEYAGFADLTWRVTDRFDIQFGAREGHYKQTVQETYTAAPFVERIMLATAPLVVNAPDADDSAFTYLVTPRFKLSPDLMLYARFASGYRIGGANASPGSTLPQFAPDKTENYEIGAKGSAFNNRVMFDTSIYYIDWRDIQLQLRDPQNGIVYFTNASGAKSQGIELSTDFRPGDGWKIGAWVALNDAELTKDIPPDPANAVASSGDRLPNSSRFSGNLSIDKELALSGTTTAFLGGSISYIGERKGTFLTGTPNRQVYPAYAQTNLRLGIERGMWHANLFANNVTDKRGVLSGGVGSLIPTEFFYIQPRTIGLTLLKNF